MDKYCTNCGKLLKENELICSNCNTPVTKSDNEYKEKRKKNKKIDIIVFTIIILIIASFIIADKIKINKFKKTYVIPYLEHINQPYKKIKLKKRGNCILYGDCFFDPVFGCDGGVCHQYQYVDNGPCTAYYFKVEPYDDNNDQHGLFSEYYTVYKFRGKYHLSKGEDVNHDIDEHGNLVTEEDPHGYHEIYRLFTTDPLNINSTEEQEYYIENENNTVKVKINNVSSDDISIDLDFNLQDSIPRSISYSYYFLNEEGELIGQKGFNKLFVDEYKLTQRFHILPDYLEYKDKDEKYTLNDIKSIKIFFSNIEKIGR